MMEHIIIAPKAEEPAPTNEDSKPEETTPTAEECLAALEKRLADLEEQLKTKDEPAAEEPAPEAPKEESSDVAALKAALAKQDESIKALNAKLAALGGTDVRADLQGDPPEESKPTGEDTLDTLAKMEDPAKRSAFVAAHADDLIRDAFRRRNR